MNPITRHWGEFEEKLINHDDYGLSNTDMEDLLYPVCPRISVPVLHQPSQEETSSFQILPPELCKSDPTVLHTIRLLQYQRTLLPLITRAQSSGADGGNLPPCPSPPQDLQVESNSNKHSYLNFLHPEVTPFTCPKKDSQKLEIEASTARLILRKSIATICAHAGFTDTTESVLRFLTDITHEFLTKLTQSLRSNTDKTMSTGNTPFHDVMEQTLHDVGIGSMVDLHSLYKDRVIGYHSKVRQKNMQFHHHYRILLNHAKETASQNQRREHKEWWNDDSNQQAGVSSTQESTTSNKPTTISDADAAFNALAASSQ